MDSRRHLASLVSALGLTGLTGACIGAPPPPPGATEGSPTGGGTVGTVSGGSLTGGTSGTSGTSTVPDGSSGGSGADSGSGTGMSDPCEGADDLCHQAQPGFLLEGGLAAVRVADMTEDGALDVVIGTYEDHGIYVVPGDGAGGLGEPIGIGLAAGVAYLEDIEVLELDGDAHLDVIVSFSNLDQLFYLGGDGSGDLSVENVDGMGGFGPGRMARGRFDADPEADLAIAGYGAGGILEFLGTPQGLMEFDFLEVDEPVYSVTTRDADLDGYDDLVFAAPNSGVVGVLGSEGGGSFDFAAWLDLGSSPFLAHAGDLNGDGLADVVALNGDGSFASVFLASGPWQYEDEEWVELPSGISDGTLADMNADGILDLVTAHEGGFEGVAILVGQGDGTFGSPIEFPSTREMYRVTTGDLNGDGVADAIAVGDEHPGSVFVVLSSSTG